MHNLSKEWAGLTDPNTGRGYYPNQTTGHSLKQQFAALKAERDAKPSTEVASMPSRPVTPTPVKGSLQAWEALRKTLATGKWGTPEGKRSVEPYQGDPTDPAFDKNKWLPYSKTPWSPGLHAIDPKKEQQASLQRREPGALLRASNQMQANALKHEITGSASLHVKLAAGLAPVSGMKTKGSLFKEVRLDRAPQPLANTTG
jgi:hypothetical protein